MPNDPIATLRTALEKARETTHLGESAHLAQIQSAAWQAVAGALEAVERGRASAEAEIERLEAKLQAERQRRSNARDSL